MNLIDLPPSIYVPIATCLVSAIVWLTLRDAKRSDREAARIVMMTDRLLKEDGDQ